MKEEEEEYDGKCEDCGNDKGVNTVCPYALEINHKEIKVCLCSKCEYERFMDT